MKQLIFKAKDKSQLLDTYVNMLPYDLSEMTACFYASLLNKANPREVLNFNCQRKFYGDEFQNILRELLATELIFANEEGYRLNEKYILEEPYCFTITVSILDKGKIKN